MKKLLVFIVLSVLILAVFPKVSAEDIENNKIFQNKNKNSKNLYLKITEQLKSLTNNTYNSEEIFFDNNEGINPFAFYTIVIFLFLLFQLFILPHLNRDFYISEVHADAQGVDNENLNDEYIIISNKMENAVNMSGYNLTDRDSNSYIFPEGFILESGKSVTVHTGKGNDTNTDLYWNSDLEIWDNEHECAYLYDNKQNFIDSEYW